MAEPKEEGEGVRVVWEVPSGFPSHYSTHLVVQHSEDDFTLTFWDMRPPVLIGTMEDKQKQLQALKEIRPTPVARIILSPSKMRQVSQVIQDNLKTFAETYPPAAEKGPKS